MIQYQTNYQYLIINRLNGVDIRVNHTEPNCWHPADRLECWNNSWYRYFCSHYCPTGAAFKAGYADRRTVTSCWETMIRQLHFIILFCPQVLATHLVEVYWLQNIAPCVHALSVMACIKIRWFWQKCPSLRSRVELSGSEHFVQIYLAL